MPSTNASFCSLSDLVERTHCKHPFIPCSFLVLRGKSPCTQPINKKNIETARLHLTDLLDILSGVHRGNFTLAGVADELAKLFLCVKHKDYFEQAGNQWSNELGDKMVASYILCELDKIKRVAIASRSIRKEDADVEGHASRLSQRSLTEFVPFSPMKKEADVPHNITALLEKNLGIKDKPAGWIYVFSSTFPGMLKIGYSASDPEESRIRDHKLCYKDISVIKLYLTPNPRRIEQLVLKELTMIHCKLAEGCTRCNTCHGEWLRTDAKSLLETVEKWIGFMNAKPSPYNRDGTLKKDAVLPDPAFKRERRRSSTNSTPTRRRSSQSTQISQSVPHSKGPILTSKCLDDDESDSDPEYSELTSHERYQNSIQMAALAKKLEKAKITTIPEDKQ